ncbi:FtsH protease activity modulator HflK [bacterium]|nr:FtsH protease activity modulator HflK [bacterium]
MAEKVVPINRKKVMLYTYGIIAFAALIWIIQGGPLYIVEPAEEGLILTFGHYSHSTGPGLHMKLPWPIQSVIILEVATVRRAEIGFRTIAAGPPAKYRDFRNDPEMRKEAQMLTGDENIVSTDMTILYRISDAVSYAFRVKEPEKALRDLAEAVVRQIVGDHAIDTVLTTGKGTIQNEVKESLQNLVNFYQLGIVIQQVQLGEVQPPVAVANSFKDVATAKEDKERIINESKGYQNEQLPQARGNAAQIVKKAEAYAAERLAIAEGESQRFKAVAREYQKAPDVTMARLYLETMERVLSKAHMVVVDEKVGVVNLNRLPELEQGGK